MSNVLLVYIKDNKALIRQEHYRKILEMLGRKTLGPRPFWLDSGWFLVDCDCSVIFSKQSCFSGRDLQNPCLKRFSWIEV